MMHGPLSMQSEAERAIDVAKAHSPSAAFWRGDVRPVFRDGVLAPDLVPGVSFNLIDDSNCNDRRLVGQFRALTVTAAPEGYIAVVAVESTALPSNIPDVLLSQVIKSTMVHQHGVMGQVVPAGEGLLKE